MGFYQDLYSAETCELGAMEQLLEGVLHLAEKDQCELESHLSFNKLTNAVKEEAVSRADLLSVEFYKDFWSLTGSEPHAVFLECLEQKISPLNCGKAVIALLPIKLASCFIAWD